MPLFEPLVANDDDNLSIISEHFIHRLDRTYSPHCQNKDNLLEEREENYKTVVYNKNGQKYYVSSNKIDHPINDINHISKQSQIGKKPEILNFEVRIRPKYPVQNQILKTTVIIPPMENYLKKRPSMSQLEKPDLSATNSKVDQNNNNNNNIREDQILIKSLNFDQINHLIDDQDIVRAIHGQKFFDDQKSNGSMIRVERLTVSTLL